MGAGNSPAGRGRQALGSLPAGGGAYSGGIIPFVLLTFSSAFLLFLVQPLTARAHFTSLEAAAGTVDVVAGDGRLALQRDVEAGRARYDALVVDAFAPDVVPVHLLTLESLQLYRSALTRGGGAWLPDHEPTPRPGARGARGAEAARLRAVRVDHAPTAGGAGMAISWMVLGSGRARRKPVPERGDPPSCTHLTAPPE